MTLQTDRTHWTGRHGVVGSATGRKNHLALAAASKGTGLRLLDRNSHRCPVLTVNNHSGARVALRHHPLFSSLLTNQQMAGMCEISEAYSPATSTLELELPDQDVTFQSPARDAND